MVLAEAFMKRNDLKKQIAGLTISATQNLWEDKDLPIDFDKGIKVHPADSYKQAIELMTELQLLNVAIAKANMVNNETLRDLETTTARIALVESIIAHAAMFPGDKQREQNYGETTPRIIENEWLINPKEVQDSLKILQEHKRDLEKTLQHSNFVTEVI
jgi:hypothetical protein